MLKTCPRQFFYQYFPHGEENDTALGFLKNATTLPLLVGTLTHDAIGMALRLFKARGRVKTDLKAPALTLFDDAIAASAKTAEVVRQGRSVRIGQRVLLHHLEDGPHELRETIARERLAAYLEAFESSSAWEILRASDRSRWEDVLAATDPKQFVDASPPLGFKKGFDLRIYTPFDAAFRSKGEFVIVDWKTGEKTGKSICEARRQTASYALWALSRGIRLERILLQPFWLQQDESWDPQPITAEEIEDVRGGIVEHDKAERRLLRQIVDSRGQVTFHARIEDFPTKSGSACAGCRYRSVCTEGKEVSTDAEDL